MVSQISLTTKVMHTTVIYGHVASARKAAETAEPNVDTNSTEIAWQNGCRIQELAQRAEEMLMKWICLIFIDWNYDGIAENLDSEKALLNAFIC